jgi:hypothetical protein
MEMARHKKHEVDMQLHQKMKHQYRIYRFGFWFFFFLAIGSVMFSVWAITSIYSNFTVVTKILDESFERTNLVMDITSSKIISCEQRLKNCSMNGVETSIIPGGRQ